MIRSKARKHLVLAFAVAAVASAATLGGSARADSLPQGGGANNVVLAQTFSDGAALVRSTTQVSHVGGPSVQSSNIAAALATGCTGCYSTAVAVQVVMYTGSPQYFLPGNAATAVNGGCTSCGSFAYAWQYLLQVDRSVTLSPAAHQEIEALRQQIADTAASIVPDTFDDDTLLKAELDGLTAQLKDIVDTQLQAAGVQGNGVTIEHVDDTPAT